MKVGDLVRVKNPGYLITGNDENEARERYPWKFEVGIVTDTEPCGGKYGREAGVYFPSHPEAIILCSVIEVIK